MARFITNWLFVVSSIEGLMSVTKEELQVIGGTWTASTIALVHRYAQEGDFRNAAKFASLATNEPDPVIALVFLSEIAGKYSDAFREAAIEMNREVEELGTKMKCIVRKL